MSSAQQRDIIRKYARPKRNGQPARCQPSSAETAGEATRLGPFTKRIIYDSREAALVANRDLVAIGVMDCEPYPCPRSKKGHWHLSAQLLTAWNATAQRNSADDV